MISRLLFALQRGLRYTKEHPQILLVLCLIIVLPLFFLYSSNQFLKAGQSNTNTLVFQRIGLLNDVFSELAVASDMDPGVLQAAIEEIAVLNSDVVKFRVVQETGDGLVIIAALDRQKIGELENARELYEKSFGEPSGITFPFALNDRQYIQSFRAIRENGDLRGYVFIESDQTLLNNVLDARKRTAYISLAILYVALLGLAYWLIRITDYRYLYQRAEQAIKTKDLFTNMIAHELRAPLTAMRGYASMIEESNEAAAEGKKYAERIRESSERLLAIVNDLLDVARIQSGKLKVETTQADLSAVVRKVTEELLPSAKEKGIDVIHSGTDEMHTAHIDPKRMQQAITNLVSNAIKYTKEGTIELALHEKGDVIELRVKDTGMGISADDQKKLFAPFFRVQSDDVSQVTGTGLGMWITRQLIELMGATIGVESIKGIGTHIVVTVPKRKSWD